MVPWIRGTLKKLFLASSTPLAMAAGTSLALPYPTPTVPSPSPTTTRAVKLKRRPPLTTLATRLMVTTRSTYWFLSSRLSRLSRPPRLSRRSPRSVRSPPPAGPVPRRCCPGIRCSSSQQLRSRSCSEGQTAFAGALGDRRDPAVVLVATTVEHDGLDTGVLGTGGHELADLLGLGRLVTVEGAQVGLHRRGRGHGLAHGVVDNLDEEVTGGARHDEAGTARGAGDLLATAHLATDAGGSLGLAALDDHCHGLLTGLSDLATDLLARVANALALVRVGLAQLADVRRDLTDELLVDALHREAGRVLDGEADAGGSLDEDRVRVSERELEVRALRGDTVTRAVDLHLLLVALGDTEDHVVDERPGQAVTRARVALVVGALDLEVALAQLDRDRLHDGQGELTLGALDDDVLALDLDVHTRGDGDRKSSDSRHVSVSLPDVGEDFPTHALLVCLAVGQQTVRRRLVSDAAATENLGQVRRLGVDAQAGLAHATHAGDGALAVRAVLEVDGQRLADLGLLDLPRGDVALALEDLGDVLLQLRVRHGDDVVVRRVGVPDAGQHVRNRVSHGHVGSPPFLTGVSTFGSDAVRRMPWGRPTVSEVCWSESCIPRHAGVSGALGGRSPPSVWLPGALGHARQLARVRHLAKADAAEAELAVHRVRATALLATGVRANLELRLPVRLVNERGLRHVSSP